MKLTDKELSDIEFLITKEIQEMGDDLPEDIRLDYEELLEKVRKM